MNAASIVSSELCPACGGAGGGPFGRAGSAWDVEDYVCARCEGAGRVNVAEALGDRVIPGVVKTSRSDAPGKRAGGSKE